ncbi:response regulator transcription factor [Myroides sp. LJL116]
MINVAVIEKNLIVLNALKYGFDKTKDIKLVLHCETGEDFFNNHSSYSIDVVIVEVGVYGTPDKVMLELLSDIQQILPQAEVLIFTSLRFLYVKQRCLAQRVKGFLPKPEGILLINSAIRDVFSGKWYLSKDAFDFLNVNRDILKNKVQVLTPVQIIIVGKFAKGKLGKEIAAELGISENTVSSHKKSIYEKWHVSNTPEMLMLAVRLKYIDPNNLELVDKLLPTKPPSITLDSLSKTIHKSNKSPYD